MGRSLVWLETNLNPTMTILLFSSILSTKRQWQSSTSTRQVWQRQKGVMSQIQSKEAIFDHQHQNGELVRLWRCPDCDSQKAQLEAPSAALQSACPALREDAIPPLMGKNYRDELLSYHPTPLRQGEDARSSSPQSSLCPAIPRN